MTIEHTIRPPAPNSIEWHNENKQSHGYRGCLGRPCSKANTASSLFGLALDGDTHQKKCNMCQNIRFPITSSMKHAQTQTHDKMHPNDNKQRRQSPSTIFHVLTSMIAMGVFLETSQSSKQNHHCNARKLGPAAANLAARIANGKCMVARRVMKISVRLHPIKWRQLRYIQIRRPRGIGVGGND